MNNSDKPMKVDWDKAPEGATTLQQNGNFVAFCRDGFWWNARHADWDIKGVVGVWEVIATRPKPPLTKEQVDAIYEYANWCDRELPKPQHPVHVNAFLKQRSCKRMVQRGGEHETD